MEVSQENLKSTVNFSKETSRVWPWLSCTYSIPGNLTMLSQSSVNQSIKTDSEINRDTEAMP